jgi:putative transcriptional regulator
MSGGTQAVIRHHPSAATLVAHAAGTLWAAAGPVVAAHLARCPDCRAEVELAEAVGGLLLEALPPAPLAPDALARAMERLDDAPGPAAGKGARDPAPGAWAPAPGGAAAEDPVAATLRGLGLPVPRLRWLAPGVRHAVLLRGGPGPGGGGTLRLLRVRPGAAVPRHAHRGAELTLVLEGAFADEAGRYGPGDLAEAEAEVSHRPVAEGPADCVCLVAAQGLPRFGGLLGRLFGTDGSS